MNRTGRTAGMAVFAIGIAVLFLVFGIAYGMFTSSSPELFTPSDGAVNAVGLGKAAVVIFVRIALLFIMTLAGSLIASRGIQLYLGSSNAEVDGKSVGKKKTTDKTS